MALPEDEAKRDPETGDSVPESPESSSPDTENPDSDLGVTENRDTDNSETDGDSAANSEPVTPEDELANALAEVEKFRELALRAEAEMQNMQRRTARDVENAHKFGIEKFLQNLFPVVDSLEKAVEAAGQASEGTEDAMAEGVRLCYKLLLDVLAKENVEIIDPVGEPFDPQEHQAMSMVENPDMEPNTVFAVVQKGFKLNGRLVRAAMVMVTKASSAQAPADG